MLSSTTCLNQDRYHFLSLVKYAVLVDVGAVPGSTGIQSVFQALDRLILLAKDLLAGHGLNILNARVIRVSDRVILREDRLYVSAKIIYLILCGTIRKTHS